MRRRRRQSFWAFAAAAVMSAGLQLGVVVAYELTRPPPPPRLMVSARGEGHGMVVSIPDGIECGQSCVFDYEPGQLVKLVATVSEKSTFEGWEGPCGNESPRLFRWAEEVLLDSASYDDVTDDAELYEFLAEFATAPPTEWPLECLVRVDGITRVTASFGRRPDTSQVEWVAMDQPRDDSVKISLPDPSETMPEEMAIEELLEESPIEPEPEEEKKEELLAQQQQQQQEQKKKVETYNMTSVEVPDENEVEEAPNDARFLSDKNRDVTEESRAEDTNLERAQEGKVAFSEESDVKSEEVGAAEDDIAQLEETEASSLDAEREEETAHTGEDTVAEGVLKGEEGEEGEDGQDGDNSSADQGGMLSMRGIDGRGTPGGPTLPEETEEQGGKRGRSGKKGRRGIKTQLSFEDYKRIVGEDVAREEVKVARRKVSKRRGRFEKKMEAIRSSLENFTPDVKPGNQTALKTRAAPFAVYIARMHRRIHELWGFGFLEDLDDKPSTHELNDWSLWTKIEVVINPDGTVDKTTIVNPSGVLPFDVAAIDVILTAAPFEEPPAKIRSPDGKVYLHWRFHRDWRQCGTFGVDPFILSEPPAAKQRDEGVMDDADLARSVPKRSRKRKERQKQGDEAAAARAAASVAAPDDPTAEKASNLWLTGFAHADIEKMLKASAVPFRSGERIVATRRKELSAVYRNLLKETKNRQPRQAKLVTAAGYRRLFGSIPAGIDTKGNELFFVVRLRKQQFTLLLRPNSEQSYEVVGLYR